MPLLDHFRPPLSERRPWESLHTAWAGSLADALNDHLLPPGYVALEQVHAGAAVEIDVATYSETGGEAAGGRNGGTVTAARTVWVPAAAPLVIPAVFPPSCTIQIISTEGGRTLVAAIELVSPGNKDRATKRRLFAAKCATYLARGVGLVVVDVVTSRQANMHNELADLLGWDPAWRMTDEASLYAVAYRPLRRDGADQVETWPMPLAVGEPLPTVPLSLEAEHCLALDLETAYVEACRRRRVDDALDRRG
jgi:hypothetical protein